MAACYRKRLADNKSYAVDFKDGQNYGEAQAVVACVRKVAVLVWQLLSSGEPFRYGEPRSLQAKFS